MMTNRLKDMLEGLRLGVGVAEREDVRTLRSWFVETPYFHNFVNDEVDLVLGPKGSGKTAMYRVVLDHDYGPPSLNNVALIPAFDVIESLTGWEPYDDLDSVTIPQMRGWWNSYIKTLVANHLVNVYGGSKAGELKDMLDAASLRMPDWSAKAVGQISRWLNPSPVRTEKDQPEGAFQTAKVMAEDLEEIFDASLVFLKNIGRRAWIVFDRLDEAFFDHPRFETLALQALFAAHRDISARGYVKTKLFLRDDVFYRVTQGETPVVNLSHLAEESLRWDRDSIRALLALRLVRNDVFRRQTGLRRPDASNPEGQSAILDAYFPPGTPPNFPQHKRYVSMLDWVLAYSTDASGRYNPRNVLSLFEYARREQISLCTSRGMSLDQTGGRFLSAGAILAGSVELSRIYLNKTVRAEHPSIRSVLDSLEGHSRLVTVGQLKELAGLNGDEAQVLAQELNRAGVLKRLGGGRFEVANLFVSALRSRTG